LAATLVRRLSAALVCIATPAGLALGQDLPELKKGGRLRVLAVLVDEGPQFITAKKTGAPGFDHEILQGFARLHALSLEVVPIRAWDALAPALVDGKGDVVAGGFTDTTARRAVIDFTVEVFPTRTAILTRKPLPAVATIEQLRGLKVGTIKGTSMADDLAASGIRQVDESIPPGGVPGALRSGKVQAGADGVEAALMAARADPELQIGLFLGKPGSLAYGVRKSSPQLLAALNEYLGNLRRTPTWNRLVVEYFGAAAPDILKRARQ
jgi:membrane-bound lytic murein transglycosylase F